MGERKGGTDPCDPPGKRSFVRRVWDWLFKNRSHGNLTVGTVQNIPTFSQAPDERILKFKVQITANGKNSIMNHLDGYSNNH